MELRQYWRIICKRWWLVIALPIVVLIVSLVTYRPPSPAYVAHMRFAIGIEGTEPVVAVSGGGRSDAWLASEYLADDLSQVLMGGDFAAQISDDLSFNVPAGTIFATREHRIMAVSITWADSDQAQEIAEKVGAAIQDGGADYFPQLGGIEAKAVLIDGPGIVPVGRSLKDKLDLPIRLLLAVVAGIALAFLWDYLDDSVRDREDAEALGLGILGEIPRKPPPWRRLKRP